MSGPALASDGVRWCKCCKSTSLLLGAVLSGHELLMYMLGRAQQHPLCQMHRAND